MAWIYYTGCEETLDAEIILVRGDANNPNYQFTTTENIPSISPQTIDNAPNENTVYQFKPISVGIEENENSLSSKTSLYPTIAEDELTLDFSKFSIQEYNIEVYSLEGELLKTQSSNKANETINITDLPKGLYLLKVNNQEWNHVFRFIKP